MTKLPAFMTEYTGKVDSRFHKNMSVEIPDPEFRHKLYSLVGTNAEPDGSDPRILCMTCFNNATGDAKLLGMVLVNEDIYCTVAAIGALLVVMSDNYPTYKAADLVIWYKVDGSEKGERMTEYLKSLTL